MYQAHEDVLIRPRLIIPDGIWFNKIMAYGLAATPSEVNGLGIVIQDGQDLYLADAFILEQEASSHVARISAETMAAFVDEFRSAGGQPANIRFQWHSHGKADAYCSPTDEETIEDWLGEWLISLVINDRGELYCRLDIYRPRLAIRLHPTICRYIPDDVMQAAAADIDAKVRRPTLALPPVQPHRAGAYVNTDARLLAAEPERSGHATDDS